VIWFGVIITMGEKVSSPIVVRIVNRDIHHGVRMPYFLTRSGEYKMTRNDVAKQT